jgi:hypothetical protein
MNEYLTEIETWIKNNVAIAVAIAVAVLTGIYFLFKGKKRVVHHKQKIYAPPRRRNRTLPRSVGIGFESIQRIRRRSAKRPWQIKGSLAARRHMAQIRKRR